MNREKMLEEDEITPLKTLLCREKSKGLKRENIKNRKPSKPSTTTLSVGLAKDEYQEDYSENMAAARKQSAT